MMQAQPEPRLRGFIKPGLKAPVTAGTKPSVHNNLLLVSSGVPSLDGLIGGGIPVGSCLLIVEDKYAVYSALLLKYYVAEGVMNKHAVLVATADQSPANFIKDLPAPISYSHPSPSAEADVQDSLNIAWRYQNVAAPKESQSPSFGHYYDITKVMSCDQVAQADCSAFYAAETDDSNQSVYNKLLGQLRQIIAHAGFSTAEQKQDRNILRIAIDSLGSPYWCDLDAVGLAQFLYSMRAILRASYATCMITLPSHVLDKIPRAVHLADMALRLEAFMDRPDTPEKNISLPDSHGVVRILRLMSLNSLAPPLPDTVDWVFKLKRKKFTIERMHLQPDLSDTASRVSKEPVSSCGQTTSGIQVDF